MASPARPVDHAALRTNQAVIISLLIAAFVADAPWLVALTGLVMLLGSARGRPGFLPLYRALRGMGIIKPDVVPDNPEPHRFAQLLGGLFLAAAFVGLATGLTTVGWILSWLVVALASLNLFGGFCLGCALYYWLNRLGTPGFRKAPPAGSSPGRRPPAG